MAQILYQNIETGDAHDITTLVKSARWKTRRVGSPAQLSLTLIADPAIEITEGGIVTLTENGTGLFYGYVFKYSRNESEEISVTAYDQMRYLKTRTPMCSPARQRTRSPPRSVPTSASRWGHWSLPVM